MCRCRILQRQVIFATADVGKAKVTGAASAVKSLNPHVDVQTHHVRLTADNALDLIARYDVVADGSDNFATRYLVSDACYFAKKPLVTAAVGTFDGSLTAIRAHETRPDGMRNPTYRCLFPNRRRRAPCRPVRKPESSAPCRAWSAR